MSDKTPAPVKKKAAKAPCPVKKFRKSKENIGLYDVAALTFHPLLEPVPVTGELAAQLKKDRDWKSAAAEKEEEWRQFVADVNAHGVKEPVWIIKGTQTVVEGRRRVLAVREGGGGFVPFRYCTEEEARAIMLRSVAMKRRATQESKAYLAVHLHPYVAQKERGRPSAEAKVNSAKSAELSREQLADAAGVSLRNIEEACSTWNFLQEHPAQRRKLEPLIFEGMIGLGAARAGAAGGKATKEKERPPVAYFSNCRRALVDFGDTFGDWPKWPDADREEAVKAIAASAAAWPAEVQAAVRELLTGGPAK